MLVRAAKEGDKRYMDIKRVFFTYLKPYLTDSLQKRLAFDIARCAADFGYYYIGVGFFTHGVNKFLDFVRNVRYYLHGLAEIFAAALLVQNIPVYLAGCKV